MNVVLVYRGRYQVREALDVETLAAVLKERGHDVRLVHDPDVFGVTDNVFQAPALARALSSPERIVRRVLWCEPEAVVFSVLPSTYRWCRRIAEHIKAAANIPIIFLGLHPSLAAERCVQDRFVDYVIEGEAEGVINPLLDAVSRGDEVSEIGNLWFRRGGRVVRTPRAPLVDLDALPLPDKDLFRPQVSHAYSYCAMVSRGCPFRCTFCEETCSKRLYGSGYFRRKSVDTVMRELVAGKRRYRYREVIFKDSYLSGDKGWLRELMRRYRAEIGVPFKCFCTLIGFDDETARLLKEGGCYNVEFGLQTWNEALRRDLLRRRETNADALRAFASCARHRLWYDVDHMFNLPRETEADHRLGAAAYHRLRYLNRIKVHFLVYLPGAEIVADGIRDGRLPPDAEARLQEGWESDFYDQAMAGSEDAAVVAGYAALYKVLPALPRALLRWLLAGRRVRALRRVPSVVMAGLQGLLALRSGDRRFAAYVQTYPRKVWRALVQAVAG